MDSLLPEWFVEATATLPEFGSVIVDECEIAYRTWGAPGLPGLVLVHGGAAHAGWWDHIGPLLAGPYRVVALDLSGHGDSGRRMGYTMDGWAREILAVARVSGIIDRPVVIGHSMGGWVTVTVGARFPDQVAGIIVIDSAIRQVQPEEAAANLRTAFGPLKTYRTEAEALTRFRTVPDQPTSLPYIIDRVARASTHETDRGWMWKFDPNVFGRRRPEPQRLKEVTCRVGLFRGEHGLVTPDIGLQMYELLGRRAPVIEIPLAWHHIMLDQPLPLVTGLRTLLADWDHSVPRARPVLVVGG